MSEHEIMDHEGKGGRSHYFSIDKGCENDSDLRLLQAIVQWWSATIANYLEDDSEWTCMIENIRFEYASEDDRESATVHYSIL